MNFVYDAITHLRHHGEGAHYDDTMHRIVRNQETDVLLNAKEEVMEFLLGTEKGVVIVKDTWMESKINQMEDPHFVVHTVAGAVAVAGERNLRNIYMLMHTEKINDLTIDGSKFPGRKLSLTGYVLRGKDYNVLCGAMCKYPWTVSNFCASRALTTSWYVEKTA